MKNKILLLTLLLYTIFSCKNEDEKLSPGQSVLGKYQQTQRNSSEEFDFVSIIELKAGGMAIYQGTVREKGGKVDLGFNFYYEGEFTLEEEIVVINYLDIYLLNDPDISYVSKEELNQIEIEDAFSDRYRINENYDELSYICPPNAFCIGESIFEKVD
ncbi:hypothetical protein [Algoriphagus sp.]|uniref:hypothetical protein n=1 Tax=Algoriphagus sp. TaxID=1872435 RepID=UPI0025DE1F3E|nr:hypothetical protein [Algoriphagus sp.]